MYLLIYVCTYLIRVHTLSSSSGCSLSSAFLCVARFSTLRSVRGAPSCATGSHVPGWVPHLSCATRERILPYTRSCFHHRTAWMRQLHFPPCAYALFHADCTSMAHIPKRLSSGASHDYYHALEALIVVITSTTICFATVYPPAHLAYLYPGHTLQV